MVCNIYKQYTLFQDRVPHSAQMGIAYPIFSVSDSVATCVYISSGVILVMSYTFPRVYVQYVV